MRSSGRTRTREEGEGDNVLPVASIPATSMGMINFSHMASSSCFLLSYVIVSYLVLEASLLLFAFARS